MYEVQGPCLLIWANKITLLGLWDAPLLLIHRVATNFMVWDSQEHAVSRQSSKYLTQSSSGPRNEETFSWLCSGKQLNIPEVPWEGNL